MSKLVHEMMPESARERCHYISKMINTVRDAKMLAFGLENVQGDQSWRLKSFLEDRIQVLTYRGTEVRLLFQPLTANDETIEQDAKVAPTEKKCLIIDVLGDDNDGSVNYLKKKVAEYKKLYETEYKERIMLLSENADLRVEILKMKEKKDAKKTKPNAAETKALHAQGKPTGKRGKPGISTPKHSAAKK